MNVKSEREPACLNNVLLWTTIHIQMLTLFYLFFNPHTLFYLFFKSSWLFDSTNHNSGADHITILSSGSNMILCDLCATLIIIALKLLFWLFKIYSPFAVAYCNY